MIWRWPKWLIPNGPVAARAAWPIASRSSPRISSAKRTCLRATYTRMTSTSLDPRPCRKVCGPAPSMVNALDRLAVPALREVAVLRTLLVGAAFAFVVRHLADLFEVSFIDREPDPPV